MPFIDTKKIKAIEKRPGWVGRIFSSATMTFAHWDFAEGASIHEHFHEQEEVWHIVEGELEVTIAGVTKVAGPGMVAIVPANTKHSVVALTKGKAIVADYPVRPDF